MEMSRISYTYCEGLASRRGVAEGNLISANEQARWDGLRHVPSDDATLQLPLYRSDRRISCEWAAGILKHDIVGENYSFLHRKASPHEHRSNPLQC